MNIGTAHTLSALGRWAEPWRHELMKSGVVSTGVLFTHVASIVGAGGLSFAADRSLLFSRTGESPDSPRTLQDRLANRGLAIAALTIAFVSGGALFLSDVDLFLHLGTFWVKLALVALVTANVLCAQDYDRRLESIASGGTSVVPPAAPLCRAIAGMSILLWTATLLVGTALNVG